MCGDGDEGTNDSGGANDDGSDGGLTNLPSSQASASFS